MDEVYRGYRVATKLVTGTWTARVSQARGPVVPVTARATEAEGEAICMARTRAAIDRYIAYLADGA